MSRKLSWDEAKVLFEEAGYEGALVGEGCGMLRGGVYPSFREAAVFGLGLGHPKVTAESVNRASAKADALAESRGAKSLVLSETAWPTGVSRSTPVGVPTRPARSPFGRPVAVESETPKTNPWGRPIDGQGAR